MSQIHESTLFESRASQSFASSTLVRVADLWMQPTSQRVMVALPNGETVFCTKVVKRCLLEIERVPLKVDLIIFGMLGFNFILEMDLFFRHFVIKDCCMRMVTFQVLGMDARILKGSKLCPYQKLLLHFWL